uniref:Uncharacterized protein n=1 Tax=Solanum tuberosum TaxID=4113 RepID=M1D163_SOLTU
MAHDSVRVPRGALYPRRNRSFSSYSTCRIDINNAGAVSVAVDDSALENVSILASLVASEVAYFVYFTLYGMMLIALTPNYHITPVSWTVLVICCNEDPMTCNTNL